MGNTWNGRLSLSIFGESHGPAIGMVLDGVEPGISVSEEKIRRQMKRRAPGQALATARTEPDEVEFLSGLYEGHTTGSPICGIIRNTDQHSRDYDDLKDWMRPSHADYPAWVKYHGKADMRGGGHFSGRLTAPLVLAGAICSQALEVHMPLTVASHIIRLGPYEEPCWDEPGEDLLSRFRDMPLPCEDPEKVRAIIEQARQERDSVGGVIETFVTGVKAGLGEPFFDSLESCIAHLLFSIPAVKGVSFGDGFGLGSLTGSQANDPYTFQDGKVVTTSNHNGGILGGISTGMPIRVQTVFKPTASIGKPQSSVNLKTQKTEQRQIQGRHDPCILVRGIPVVENTLFIALYNSWREVQQTYA